METQFTLPHTPATVQFLRVRQRNAETALIASASITAAPVPAMEVFLVGSK